MDFFVIWKTPCDIFNAVSKPNAAPSPTPKEPLPLTSACREGGWPVYCGLPNSKNYRTPSRNSLGVAGQDALRSQWGWVCTTPPLLRSAAGRYLHWSNASQCCRPCSPGSWRGEARETRSARSLRSRTQISISSATYQLWPWGSYLNSLSLNVLNYEMG